MKFASHIMEPNPGKAVADMLEGWGDEESAQIAAKNMITGSYVSYDCALLSEDGPYTRFRALAIAAEMYSNNGMTDSAANVAAELFIKLLERKMTAKAKELFINTMRNEPREEYVLGLMLGAFIFDERKGGTIGSHLILDDMTDEQKQYYRGRIDKWFARTRGQLLIYMIDDKVSIAWLIIMLIFGAWKVIEYLHSVM